MSERHDLDLLRWHWSAFYEITSIGQVWRAARHDDGRVLAATGATRLRQLITADFAAQPVPRRHQTSRQLDQCGRLAMQSGQSAGLKSSGGTPGPVVV